MRKMRRRIVEGIVRCNHDGGNIIPSNKKKADLDDTLLVHFRDRYVRIIIEEIPSK